MAETAVETPKPAEQLELAFKSEEEKAAALNKVSEEAELIPSGKTADEWQRDIDDRVGKISKAKIVSDTPAPSAPEATTPEVPAPAVPPAPAPVASPAPEAPQPWEKQLEGITLPEGVSAPKTPDAALRAFITDQQHIAYLKRERIPQIEKTYQQKLEEMQKKIKELETNRPVSPAPVVPPAPVFTKPAFTMPKSNLEEINRLRQEMDAIPIEKRIDERDFYEKSSRLNALLAEELNRTNTIAAQWAQPQPQQPVKIPELDEIKQRLQMYEDEKKREKEERDTREAAEKQQNLLKAAYGEINDFALAKDSSGKAKHPEFGIRMKYEDMNKVYEGFGADVARILYQRDPQNMNEVDAAVYSYLGGNPLLKQACDQRGIVPPEDLDPYLRLTELHMHYTGNKLNPVTKQWEQNVNPVTGKQIVFSNLESALHDKKLQDGTWAQQLANAANAAVRSVQQHLSNAGNVAPTMPNQGGTAPADVEKPMTKQDAAKIINEFGGHEEEILLAARTNPNDPRFLAFNKALVTLGLQPVSAM